MELNEYQAQVARNLPRRHVSSQVGDSFTWTHAVLKSALDLAGSVGKDVVDPVKKQVYHGHYLDARGIAAGLNDALDAIAKLSELYGLDLEEVAIWNDAERNEQ